MKYITGRYESVAAFCGYLSAGKTQPAFDAESGSLDNTRPKWHGTKNYAEADRLFKYGDIETKKQIEAAAGGAAKLQSFANVTRTTRVHSTHGYKISIGAYMSGAAKCFVKRAKSETQGRTATIVFNLTYPCFTTAKEMAKTAANLAKAVLQTERQRGIKFNVYTLFCTTDAGTTVAPIVKVKSSSQWFNLNTMAYSLANPSMLRRHFFRWLEITPNVPSDFNSGYGTLVTDKKELSDAVAATGVKADYILDGYSMLGKAPEQIREIINAM